MWRDNPVDSIKLELVCLDLIWIYCEYHIPFEDLFACLHWVDVGPFLWQDWHPHTLWQLSTKGQGKFAIRPKVGMSCLRFSLMWGLEVDMCWGPPRTRQEQCDGVPMFIKTIYKFMSVFRMHPWWANGANLNFFSSWLLPWQECPIYTKFDWHKPQLATIVGLLAPWTIR